MYKYSLPHPITVKLIDNWGFDLRKKAAEYIEANRNITGAERGSIEEQGFGALAEIVIRNKLGLPDMNSKDHPISYDFSLPTGVKVDVKCRGGILPLETPSNRMLPGTTRQRKWILYICGWVTKKRVIREGVYLPRGSLTEQGRTWFIYRGQEVEFYNKNLNGLADLEDLLTIERADVQKDEKHKGDLNITSVDAMRIVYDLAGRGILTSKQIDFVKSKTSITNVVKPILHANQYFHLLKWLKENNQITNTEYEKAKEELSEELYDGI